MVFHLLLQDTPNNFWLFWFTTQRWQSQDLSICEVQVVWRGAELQSFISSDKKHQKNKFLQIQQECYSKIFKTKLLSSFLLDWNNWILWALISKEWEQTIRLTKLVHRNMVSGSSMIGFPLIIADSKQDMPGFEPGPARLEHQRSTNCAAISKKLNKPGRSRVPQTYCPSLASDIMLLVKYDEKHQKRRRWKTK